MCQAKFTLMMLWGNGKVETEGWAMKGADAETVNQLLVEDFVFSGDLARRGENRGSLRFSGPVNRGHVGHGLFSLKGDG